MRKVCFVPILLLLCAACNKLSPEVVSGIHLASVTAHERAAFVNALAGKDAFLQAHAEGLSAQATALGQFDAAIQISNGKLTDASKVTLAQMADTATARVKTFAEWLLRQTSPPEWATAHLEALNSTASMLNKIKAQFEAEKAQVK
jgi:hypothetical protein